jgi:predicted ATP-dependent endonuclease of OLD family
MFIQSVEVKNFRSILNQKMDFEELTALVGKNGAGKSSFLYSIKTFYEPNAVISEEDFFGHDISNPIEITITYNNLTEKEKKEFSPYIVEGSLIVKKRITKENDKIIQKYYGIKLQIPIFAEIRKITSKIEKKEEWNTLVNNKALPDLSQKASKADQVDQMMEEYESNHPELKEPLESEYQFFGATNIGGGKLDNYTKFVLIPAVKEASDEVTNKKGAISQILDMIVIRKINERPDIKKFKSEFEERAKKIYNSNNLTELKEVSVSISKLLGEYAPGSELNLKWNELKLPEISLPTPIASLTEDNFEGDISKKGHGLQRALILTLLQYLAMIPSMEMYNENSTNIDSTDKSLTEIDNKTHLILAIEEPELFLHPSKCRYLAKILLELAVTKKSNSNENQIIYSTHSPFFVDLKRFNQIRIIRKEILDNKIPQSIVTHYSLEQVRHKLNSISDSKGVFSEEKFKAHLLPIFNTIVNEGFFADAVVIVEGLSEVGALWKMQEILNRDWDKKGISIIPANGKKNIYCLVIIFKGFNIPTYFIFDADKNSGESEKKYNHKFLKLAGISQSDDFPPTQIQEYCAIFENNLEDFLLDELGKADFDNFIKKVASELGYPKKRVLKKISGSYRFVEIVYENGRKLPRLEQIVEKITELIVK